MRRTLFTALAVVACNGDPSRTAPGTHIPWSPPDTDSECVDSGCDASPWFDITYLTWSAQFGYSRPDDRLTAVATPYGPVEPSIELLLGTKRWSRSGFDSGDTTAYCLVSLPLSEVTTPAWVTSDAGLWFGVGYQGAEPLSTCDKPGYELDPSKWGDDPIALIAGPDGSGGSWGAAVGELSENAHAIVQSSFRPEDLDYVFGGAMAVPLLSGIDDDVYGIAYELDELGAVSIGDDGSLDAWLAQDVRGPSGGVRSAWYNVVALYIYRLSP